ncbi:Dolichyl-phosphate-mannose-protein mannosyltransferase [Hyunsoonleella jejuensis]|uniref:Dolichyl-phosphate-mannose-protein mannosyltransferase n=1 Tax=Hyunsoonleella jejuensis TaxID=419940 RepID=A0A1H9D9V3_9FLAO|nr:glycosyltransferase family 39 protein [Hyunsoonleella jejuensis]SEQ09548.1 Dolichyl-phosphate-mannose-protein mannosyltransferase [Hyunsoonleella jejuensis]
MPNILNSSFWNTKRLLLFSCISTIVYFVLRTETFTRLHVPYGDENSFLKAIDNIEANGFLAEWMAGNFSPSFFLASYPFTLLLENPLNGFRIVSLICTIISVILLYNFAKNKLKLNGIFLYSSLILIINFLGYRIFWQGINDDFLHLLVIYSVTLLYNIHVETKIKHILFLGIIIGLIIGTRISAFIILPGYIFFLYRDFKTMMKVGAIALMVGFCLHAPSLLANKSLSSINKDPENGLTWAQLNYVSQIYIYENKIPEHTRITWEELQNYIDTYGSAHLPKTFIESVTFNWSYSIKEFFNELWFTLHAIFFRFFGLGLFVILAFSYKMLKKEKHIREELKFTKSFFLFLWSYTFLLCFVVLTSLEIRWYTSFIFLGILFFHQLLENPEWLKLKIKSERILNINLILLLIYQTKFIFTDSNLLSDVLRKVAPSIF